MSALLICAVSFNLKKSAKISKKGQRLLSPVLYFKGVFRKGIFPFAKLQKKNGVFIFFVFFSILKIRKNKTAQQKAHKKLLERMVLKC